MVWNKSDAARLPRERPYFPGSEDAAQKTRDASYSVVTYLAKKSAFFTSRPNVDQKFEVPGDHIHVLEISGSGQIAISTDGRNFVPVREGDVISRSFSSFKVRQLASNLGTTSGLAAAPIRATFVVSYGRMIERAAKTKGFRAGFPVRKFDVDSTGVDVLQAFNEAGFLVTNGAYLKDGGTILIKNLDLVAPVFLYHGKPGAWDPTNVTPPCENYSWQIEPGETLTLDVDSSLMFITESALTTGVATPVSLCMAVNAGTVQVNVMLSRWNDDTSDTESQPITPVKGYSD